MKSKKTIKNSIIFSLVIIFLSLTIYNISIVVNAEPEIESEVSYSDLLDEIDFTKLDEILSNSEFFSNVTFKELVETILNNEGVDKGKLLSKLLELITSKVTDLIPIFSLIVGIILVFSMLIELRSGLLNEEVQSLITSFLALIVVIILSSFVTSIIIETKEIMLSLKDQMFAVFPIMLTLIYATGGVTSVATLSPTLYFLSVIISDIVVKIVFPLAIFMLVLSFVETSSPNLRFSRLQDFTKSLIKNIFGVTLTVFTATIALSGLACNFRDKVLYKTAKYALNNSVPIVGRFIKDGLDLAILSSLAIKNAVGVVALIVFIGIIISPILKLYITSLMFKLISGITESFCDKKIGSLLVSSADSISIVASSLLIVSLMYFVSIMALLLIANFV